MRLASTKVWISVLDFSGYTNWATVKKSSRLPSDIRTLTGIARC